MVGGAAVVNISVLCRSRTAAHCIPGRALHTMILLLYVRRRRNTTNRLLIVLAFAVPLWLLCGFVRAGGGFWKLTPSFGVKGACLRVRGETFITAPYYRVWGETT